MRILPVIAKIFENLSKQGIMVMDNTACQQYEKLESRQLTIVENLEHY